MGLYSTIGYKCVHCRANTQSQSKIIGNQSLDYLRNGSTIDFQDCVLALKDSCEKCDKFNAVIIRNNQIVGITNITAATLIEKRWGELIEVQDKIDYNEK